MGDNEEENSNKVIFLGESGVGKTNLIRISTGQEFASQKLPTTNVSSEEKKFIFNNKEYIFHLWDTIGQEKYKSITKLFFRNAKIVISHANNHLLH